jgi:hypothetical protein
LRCSTPLRDAGKLALFGQTGNVISTLHAG